MRSKPSTPTPVSFGDRALTPSPSPKGRGEQDSGPLSLRERGRGEGPGSPEGRSGLGTATILDAGVGNLGNLGRALHHVGATPLVTDDPNVVASSRCLLLPGVGAFRPPRERLRGALEEALGEALAQGAWLLGICVGYQLLFDSSEEFGTTDGLGLLPGSVRRLEDTVPLGGDRGETTVALPHIGWNRLHGGSLDGGSAKPHPLLAGIAEGSYVYFVHSYAPRDLEPGVALAEATHGVPFAAVAGRGRVLGTQFHPEKSGRTGLRLLRNYLEICHGADPGD